MEIVNLSNHTIRKFLKLKILEMAVLCDIKKMSQNKRTEYWCVRTNKERGNLFDVNATAISNAINVLESKGYIERSDKGVKPTQYIIDLDMKQENIGILTRLDNGTITIDFLDTTTP